MHCSSLPESHRITILRSVLTAIVGRDSLSQLWERGNRLDNPQAPFGPAVNIKCYSKGAILMAIRAEISQTNNGWDSIPILYFIERRLDAYPEPYISFLKGCKFLPPRLG